MKVTSIFFLLLFVVRVTNAQSDIYVKKDAENINFELTGKATVINTFDLKIINNSKDSFKVTNQINYENISFIHQLNNYKINSISYVPYLEVLYDSIWISHDYRSNVVTSEPIPFEFGTNPADSVITIATSETFVFKDLNFMRMMQFQGKDKGQYRLKLKWIKKSNKALIWRFFCL